MKVIDILKRVNDLGLYIELVEIENGETLGTFKKNDSLLVDNKALKNKKVKKINVQGYYSKKVLILGVE